MPRSDANQSTTWADFLRSQAEALLACDLFETRTLTGVRLNVFAVIERSTRRVRILGATTHPTGEWTVQLGHNLLMDLQDAGSRAKFLIRERDSKFTAAFDALVTDAGLKVVTTGIQDSANERPHGALDTNVPARAPGPHLDLEPEPPSPCAQRVRNLQGRLELQDPRGGPKVSS